MRESQYIQEVRRLIGILKNADILYKGKKDNARKVYESECTAANAELQTIRKESEINLAAAKNALRKASSHYLLKELSEIKISWEDIDKSFQLPGISNVDSKKELKKNVLNATQTTQKIEEKLEELQLLIGDQNQFIENQKKKKKRRNTFLILMAISAVILIFLVAINTLRSRQIKSHYIEAIEALEAKNWGKAFIQSKMLISLGKSYKDIQILYKEHQPTITVLKTMEFVWIPGGCFNMGSPPSEVGHKADERPVHEVCVDGFWMGKTEVTNEQFRKWIQTHKSNGWRDFNMNKDDQPVAFVNWYEAKGFATWLTENSEGYKFRLPTEAEWEYAARAGTTTSRFWGDDPVNACQYANAFDERSNHLSWVSRSYHNCNDAYVLTAPVGSFLPNPFGLYDMLGNVWEWCEDTYRADAYAIHNRNNPINNSGGADRVLRGGGWNCAPDYVRCACRIAQGPTKRGLYSTGFRLVMTK
jgi:sulfatase modifying factor 1